LLTVQSDQSAGKRAAHLSAGSLERTMQRFKLVERDRTLVADPLDRETDKTKRHFRRKQRIACRWKYDRPAIHPLRGESRHGLLDIKIQRIVGAPHPAGKQRQPAG
jgi:hypothetical protein